MRSQDVHFYGSNIESLNALALEEVYLQFSPPLAPQRYAIGSLNRRPD
jgi:hypothetical protein